jgi:hypothetical protein
MYADCRPFLPPSLPSSLPPSLPTVGGYIRVQAVVIVGAYIELQLDGQALQTPVLGVLSDRKKGMDGREGRREKGREGWQQRT